MATLRLRDDKLASFCRIAGIKTDAELAKRMGVDPATVSRVRTGRAELGARFIAGLITVFGADMFGDLFAIEPERTEELAS